MCITSGNASRPAPVSTALTSGLAVRLSGIPPLSGAGDITLEG
jgi:hypothetical protein